MPNDEQQTTEVTNDQEFAATREGLSEAERKYRTLVDKRNSLNDKARAAREARDALNAQKAQLVQKMKDLQGQRDSLNKAAREAKDARNMYQAEAKQLIAVKQAQRKSGGEGEQIKGIRALETQLRELEHRHETQAMTPEKEKEHMEKIKAVVKELTAARAAAAEQGKILEGIADINAKIDELFKKADEAHKQVVELSNQGQSIHEQLDPLFKELRHLDAKSDEKHQEYIKTREEANAVHAECVQMRETVLKQREERNRVYRERKALVTDQKDNVKRNLFDEEKLDEKADDAVKLLMSKGKIEL
ncbi:MAG TPA: hypothetical protein VNZ52_07455 [Candidatus Thermoplasmatota archaeon]|nr:hypothetical protein [Candidatus Thermoplasmatota archaeon]